MALDQSALTDLLEALRAGGDLDFMREAMQLVLSDPPSIPAWALRIDEVPAPSRGGRVR